MIISNTTGWFQKSTFWTFLNSYIDYGPVEVRYEKADKLGIFQLYKLTVAK